PWRGGLHRKVPGGDLRHNMAITKTVPDIPQILLKKFKQLMVYFLKMIRNMTRQILEKIGIHGSEFQLYYQEMNYRQKEILLILMYTNLIRQYRRIQMISPLLQIPPA